MANQRSMSDDASDVRRPYLLTALLICKQTLCFAETACKQCFNWSERLIAWHQKHLWPKINIGMIWLLLQKTMIWASCSRKIIFYFEHSASPDEKRRGMCWLLSVFGIASVCAKPDTLVSKRLSFIFEHETGPDANKRQCVPRSVIGGVP